MKAIEIILAALIRDGYSMKEAEYIMSKFLEEEKDLYLELRDLL